MTLNVICYRGTLQSQWSTLSDSTSRKAEENVNVTDESRSSWYSIAGMEQVVLQMTAEGGDRRGVPNGSGKAIPRSCRCCGKRAVAESWSLCGRDVVSVSTSRSRNGLETYPTSRLVSEEFSNVSVSAIKVSSASLSTSVMVMNI